MAIYTQIIFFMWRHYDLELQVKFHLDSPGTARREEGGGGGGEADTLQS